MDDSVKDSRSGDFDPLNILGGEQAELSESKRLKDLVMSKLSYVNQLLDLLPHSENIPVLKNIVCYGMPFRLNEVYEKHIEERKKNG